MAPISSDRPLFFISAAEPSADGYAAALIREVQRVAPDARFAGVAGPRMIAAGCEGIFDMTRRAAMLTGAFGLLGVGYRLLRRIDRLFAERAFAAVVLIDSPTLHLPMAAVARKHGLPVLYYVAPQLWAWGGWRIRKLRRRVDRLAVILPFEESYFRNRGVHAQFVGHPLLDELRSRVTSEDEVERLRAMGRPLVALLPGSRRHVVSEVFPGQLDVASGILREFPDAAFTVSVANPSAGEAVSSALESGGHAFAVERVQGQPGNVIAAADLVLVASGTTTLEVAWYRKPMIVMYNASRLFYHLAGRWLLRTPHLSLPNILAGKRIVPEFMPCYRSTSPIVEAAVHLLVDQPARARVFEDLESLIAGMGDLRASQMTARLLLELAKQGTVDRTSG